MQLFPPNVLQEMRQTYYTRHDNVESFVCSCVTYTVQFYARENEDQSHIISNKSLTKNRLREAFNVRVIRVG